MQNGLGFPSPFFLNCVWLSAAAKNYECYKDNPDAAIVVKKTAQAVIHTLVLPSKLRGFLPLGNIV